MTPTVDSAVLERAAVVIPAYNHGPQLGGVLLKTRELGLPIFVVDDGSTDETAEVARGFAGVRLLSHGANRGKGAALLTGFAAAAPAADWAITVDADGQHHPADGLRLLQAVTPGEPALVVGNRRGMAHDNVPWTSRFGRGFSNFWVAVSGGPRLRDTQSGLRVYPVPEVLTLRPRGRRYQFEVEILALARLHGIPVREVDVSVRYRPGGERVSHFRPWTDFWRNARTFTRLITMRLLLPRATRRRLTRRAGPRGQLPAPSLAESLAEQDGPEI